VSGSLKLDLAQFRELAAFAQFSSDLDAETKQRIERGERLTELLKQKQYSPLSIAEQTISLLAATKGAFDVVPTDKVKDAQAVLLSSVTNDNKDIIKDLNTGNKPDEKLEAAVLKIAEKVGLTFNPGAEAKAEAAKTEKSKKEKKA
jgi:F-type H+-transporting ATPase subunit alpha